MFWVTTGALICALSIAGGAFGAHGLSARLDTRGLELWETAARYLMYGGVGVILIGIVSELKSEGDFGRPAFCLVAGTALFSGTVSALALGAPRWLGAVTPLGGLGMILGLLWFAWSSLQA